MLTHAAFKFELDPNNVQRTQLNGHCRAAKIAHNWMLAQVKADLTAKVVDPDHVSVGWSYPELRRAWNHAKASHYPEWANYSSKVYASAAINLARALANWRQSRKGLRRGQRVRFPHFKRRVDSFMVEGNGLGVCGDRHIRLPVVGVIRTKESTRKLRRMLDTGAARVLMATVSTHCGRWYVSFSVEMDRPERKPERPWETVGVDAGLSRLATIVSIDGEVVERVENPRHLKKAERRLARYQRTMARRQAPNRKTGQRGSKRHRKQADKVARLHKRVADKRRDSCHKLTTRLARTHGTVVVEKLNIAGMTRNRRLAKAVADSGMGKIRPMVAYKAPWYGSTCVEADQWYPSSKLCSACGEKNDRLTLGHRRWTCASCGVEHDRDDNAGLNLARYMEGTASAAGTEAGGLNARGEDVSPRRARRPSWIREARTASAGKSSSVPTQDGTTDGARTIGPLDTVHGAHRRAPS